jgi:hypothetical protein
LGGGERRGHQRALRTTKRKEWARRGKETEKKRAAKGRKKERREGKKAPE